MAKDVVCAEAELSIAANNLVEYADFLCRTMEAYIAVLSEIQERGIQDDLVCSKLSAIALALKPYKTSIKDECEEVAIDVNAYIDFDLYCISHFTTSTYKNCATSESIVAVIPVGN